LAGRIHRRCCRRGRWPSQIRAAGMLRYPQQPAERMQRASRWSRSWSRVFSWSISSCEPPIDKLAARKGRTSFPRRVETARTRLCLIGQTSEYLVERDRKVPDPRAARVIDCIGDRGSGAADSELADSLALQRIGSLVELGKEHRL